jgi:hypothetical protein
VTGLTQRRWLGRLSLGALGALLVACASARPGPRRMAGEGTREASPSVGPMPSIGARTPLKPLSVARRALPNGVEICVVERHELPVVHAMLSVPTPRTAPFPLARAWTVALRERSVDSPSQRALADAAGVEGGALYANATPDWVHEVARAPSDKLPRALDRAFRALTDDTMPKTTLEIVDQRLSAWSKVGGASPGDSFEQGITKLHLARPRWYHAWTSDDVRELGTIRPERLVEVHRKALRQGRIHLIAVGDTDLASVADAAAKLTLPSAEISAERAPLGPLERRGDLPLIRVSDDGEGGKAGNATNATNATSDRDVPLFHRVFTGASLAAIGVFSRADDHHATYAEMVLREWLYRRLQDRLRADLSMTYGVNVDLVSPDGVEPRTWMTGWAEVTPGDVRRATAAWLDVIERALRDGPTPEELAVAERAILDRTEASTMRLGEVVDAVFWNVWRGRPCDAPDDVEAEMRAIGVAEVREAARRLFGDHGLTVLLVGSEAMLEARSPELTPLLQGRAPR